MKFKSQSAESGSRNSGDDSSQPKADSEPRRRQAQPAAGHEQTHAPSGEYTVIAAFNVPIEEAKQDRVTD